jgi:hypothetical protein
MRSQPTPEDEGVRRGTAAATALWLIVVLAAAHGTLAQDAPASKQPHVVPKATSEVTIDGVIDEQAWHDALTLELDYEVRPGENIEPPVRTVVLITYDEGRVLVALRPRARQDPRPVSRP